MQGRSDETGVVARFRQLGREPIVDKIGHALRRCRLRAPTLHPSRAFDALLQPHHAQRVRFVGECSVAFGQRLVLQRLGHPRSEAVVEVFGTGFDHHARIRPTTAAVGGTHAVDHQLFGAGGGGHDEAARAHAEGIHAAPVHLLHEGIFGRGEVAAASLAVVILNLVDEMGRMLQTHAHGHPFLFDLHSRGVQIAINVAGGVSGGEHHGAFPLVAAGRAHTLHALSVGREEERIDTRAKMHLTARFDDLPPHGGDDAREAVGANVGVRVGKNVGGGTMLAEDAENAGHIAALLGAGVEFSVRKRPRAAFAE